MAPTVSLIQLRYYNYESVISWDIKGEHGAIYGANCFSNSTPVLCLREFLPSLNACRSAGRY